MTLFARNCFFNVLGVWALWLAFTANVNAREFTVSGVTLDLRDVTAEVDVYFTSMRLNRAVNQWNVEVSVSNKVGQTISGPLILVVESFTGTTGPMATDGTSQTQPFFDLSAQMPRGLLTLADKSTPRTIALGYTAGGSPKLVTRVFAAASSSKEALGFVRSLNAAGQPLPGVKVEESGPDGAKEKATENQFGIITLGKSAGSYIWKFSFNQHLPVWRRALLQSNSVVVVPYPRLTPRSGGGTISPLTGGTVSNQTVKVQFAPGGASQEATAYLTGLDGQSLPGLLPRGWSPLQAFWIEFNFAALTPPTATMQPWGPFNPNETGVLVRWNELTLEWDVVQLLTSTGTNTITTALPGAGAYALVVADIGPTAPPAAPVNQPLPAATASSPNLATLVADGNVEPTASPASLIPEEVTGTAVVNITNTSGALPSGLALRCDVRENYRMTDGTRRVTPPYDNYVIGYRRPGFAATNVLRAVFPVRPLVLFDATELDEAVVHLDVLPPGDFGGSVLTTEGGLASGGRFRVMAGAGGLDGPQAVLLRERDIADFTDLAPGLTVIGAFDLALAGVAPGQPLSLQLSNAPANALLVLARVLHERRAYGIEPVERLATDNQGRLFSLETNATDRLPGMTGAGQYLLVQVNQPQALVKGLAQNSLGQAIAGLLVRLGPWTTLSHEPDGRFLLIAPAGTNQLTITDLASGDIGQTPVPIAPGQMVADISLGTALTGPRVVTIVPAPNADRVARVTSVVINFSRALNPATLLNGGVQLLLSNSPVATSLSLNLANSRATLLPAAVLEPNARYTVSLSTNITDTTGRRIEGQTEFEFTTVPLSVRDAAAQLIVYEPGATNIPPDLLAKIPGFVPGSEPNIVVVQGTAGSADPGVPVIIINEGSGETATVLSKSDGSFATFITGQAQDFVSATFVNLNGTRIYLPLNRQLFDDGSVGLFPQGGTLTAQGTGGPVELTVPAGAIPTRTKFKLVSINVSDLEAKLGGVMPSNGVVAGSALNLRIEGPQPTLPLQVKFPVNLTALGYPTNEAPTNVAAMLAIVRNTQDVTTFEVLSQMTFTPQAAQPQNLGPRNLGPRPLGGGDADQLAAGALEGILSVSGPGFIGLLIAEHVIAPLLFGPLPVAIKGKVAYLPLKDLIEAEEEVAGGVGLVGGALDLAKVKNPLFHISVAADFALNSAKILLSKPLSGAFVTLNLSENPATAQPGRLQPGMVFATTDAEGQFLIVAPKAGASYLINAEHPLYQSRLTLPCQPVSFNPLAGSLTDSLFKNFYFGHPLAILTPPHVNVAVVPVRPAPGQTCEVQISASQPSAAPNVGVVIKSTGMTNLLTGGVETNAQAVLTDVVKTTEGKTTIWSGKLTANKPVRVTLKLTVQGQNAAQSFGPEDYPIEFTGAKPPVVVTNIPPPDTNDLTGPLVIETRPVENGFIGEDGTITIFFNKPVDSSLTNNFGGIFLSGLGPIPNPIITLTPDQRTLLLQYPGLTPGQEYRLTLSSSWIQGLGGLPLDQRPSTPGADSFTTTFRTPAAVSAPLPYLSNGKGAVISGKWLYALDQSSQGNFLNIYDIENPLSRILVNKLSLRGAARDLVVIPKYPYVRNLHSKPETNDLVVVVGGDLDTIVGFNGDVTVRGQYLWVVNMGNPPNPEILASPIVTYRSSSVVPKVRWAPPYLVYQEYGQDIQMLGFVNLQELIIGYNSTPQMQLAFVDAGYRNSTNSGVDLAGNGQYVDAGDTLPIPDRAPAEFYGKKFNYVLQRTTQKILDFAVTDGGRSVGITLRNGFELNANNVSTGVPLEPSYRTLAFGGQPLNLGIPKDCYLPFGPNAYPRWVTIFNNLTLISNGVPFIRSVALVSLTPDNDGSQQLAVVDISLPETPKLLNKIVIPESMLGGELQSVTMRDDGLLEVFGRENLVLLDPTQLLSSAPNGQSHPAIISVVKGAGGITRSLGSTDYGVHAVADGGRASIVLSPPQLQFVSFPQGSNLVDPRVLIQQSESAIYDVLSGRRFAQAIPPARYQPALDIRSDLQPPNPALHFHVLVTAPGGAGESIEIGLEALNEAGQPLSNPGLGFAPVRAESVTTQEGISQKPRPSCGAPIRALKAYRLSKDPASPLFNRYLTQPFALVIEPMTEAALTQLKAQADREVLFSGAGLRAFLEPSQANNAVVGQFAAKLDSDRKLIYPVGTAQAFSVFRAYLPGDNPPPPGGITEAPGTYGSVCAHSGEFRTEAADMVLPSPRMPVSIVRTIGNQDSYEGPFGVGWDFNYNQRLTVLDPLSFPEGLQMPLVVRGDRASSEIAGSQDVLLHTGMGRTLLFKWVDNKMPPEYAQDPLVIQFEYANRVSDYYLPEKRQGTFDLFVKFKDGRFERLTPDGIRYRYGPQGRLESIIDRFPANQHVLDYDSGGLLVRIDDRSVSAPRYVEFGYYRNENTDINFNAGLDINTANPFLKGKICRLRDYAGGDVLFEYTADGFLERRLGKQVAGENGGFSGRAQTWYRYKNCRLVGVAVTANATPIFAADTATSSSGKAVAQSGTGLGNDVQLNIPVENSAASLNNLVSSVGLADGSATQFTFDSLGHPKSSTVTGPASAPATTTTGYDQEYGLLISVRHPEGNSETMRYDTNNPVFRSRGNLLSRTVDTGPRGGEGYTLTYQYELTYNLMSGDQRTPNGNDWTYNLRPDKRELLSIVYSSDGTETLEFDDHGQPLSRKDIRGVETTFAYDATTGFAKTQRLGDNPYGYQYGSDYASKFGLPSSINLPEGAAIQFEYNANLQRTRIKRGALIEDFGYDEQGRVQYHRQQMGDGKNLITRSGYDAKGFLTDLKFEGIEIDGVPGSLEYMMTPDTISRVKSVRHPRGTLQTFDYDARGNVTKTTLGDYSEKQDFDLNNNLTAVYQGGDLVKLFSHDGQDRPVTITRKTGTGDEIETRTYYPGGELKSKATLDTAFGEVAKQTDGQIDSLGRPRQRAFEGTTIAPVFSYTYAPGTMTETGPRMTTTRTWNKAGYTIGMTQPTLTVNYAPDGSGRIKQIDRHEDGANYSAYFTCDENDNRTSSADNLGPLLAFAPRAEGSLRAVTNANGHATTFDYSALGELTKKRRQDGMEFRYRQNRERQTSYKGDPSGGVGFDYDGDFRLTKSTLRNGIATTYGGFDARNMPQTIAIPGGSISALYDLQRRNAGRTVNFLSTTYSLQQVFDALNRVRIATYQQSGSGQNSATYTYDKAGPLLSARFQEDGADFRVDYTYYDDGSRKTVRYPSGAVVSEERDASGRLIGVSDSRGNIIKATAWKGNRQPSVVNLGATVQVVNQYDARGRLTASRVTGTNNSAVLSHLRYEYDAANNCKVRQFFHRGGRADSFAFDAGERVSQALLGAVPFAPAGSSQPLVSRVYNYDSGGLDYLTSVSTTTLGLSPPRFASTWSGHDAFLQPNFVDGFNRGTPDPMGNVALAQLQVRAVTGTQESTPIAAKLTHNGNGNLVGITRSDDFVEENFFQPGKLRYRRQISQSGSVIENRHYVYDDTDRLLEEYNRSGSTNQLVGRYYYASSDAPDAADLLNPSSGLLDRFYFLKDSMGSVVAMTDASGLVVERMWYDTFGQPVIEARDTRAPELKSIAAGTNGSLLLALSESVFFPTSDPGEGTGIIRFPEPTADGVVTVSINSTNITGTTELLPSYPGYAPYSVVRFTPGSPLPEVPSSLISWWPGDASVLDTVGGFAGALRGGATTGPGLVNEAFALNGTTAFVEVTNVAALNVGTTDFTLALWVNFTTTTGEQVLAEKWIQSTRSGWSLLKLADNRLRLAVGSGAGAETDIDSGVLPIKSGEWIHVAARRQGNTFALFTNGVVAASGNATFNLDAATSLKFGSRDGAGLFLKGSIDEITLHGRALTDGELTAVSGGVSVPGPVTVTLESGFLVDEWGNSNETATVAFQWYDNPGVVFYTAEPAPDTAPIRLARSSVGSPFLFHGQYFDYDTGLIYLRARFYDPFSGMFLEPDPLDYADSVNLYAGMRNNPVGYRDPTGLAAYDEMMRAALGLGKSAEAEKVLSQVSKSTRSVGEIGQEARSLTGTLGRGLEQVVSPVTRGAAQVTSGGRRLVILGLADNVRATAGRLEKAAKRISQDLRPKVDHFMDNARDWYVKVREAAAEVVAPGGKTTIRVNVTGFEGATLEEKVKAAILRGLKARMDEDYIKLLDEGHRFNGRQMEEFKQKIANDFSRRPSLNYDLTEATAVIGPNKQPFGATDLEIYMLYESGALFSQNVQFVEGVAGKVKLGNPFVGLPH